jgi:hypothetical protein
MPKICTPLTDTAIRNAKPKEKTYTLGDGEGMYFEVMPNGTKFWRMAYRQPNGRKNRLTFGKYPVVTLAEARTRRLAARRLLDQGIDPGRAKREEKETKATAAQHTFEAVARAWLAKTAASRATSTQEKNTAWLEANIFPVIGSLPISTIKPKDVLSALRRIEARGAIESAHKIKQLCGQVFRFAVASGLADRDVTVDLRGALSAVPEAHYAAITEPEQAAKLLRSIDAYDGHAYAAAALKLAPLVFVRPWRAAHRRVVRDRPRRGRMTYPWLQDEDGAGPHRAAGLASCRAAKGSACDDGARQVRIPQRPHWRTLHEREHRQRGPARHGLRQGRDDRPRLPCDGAHDHG